MQKSNTKKKEKEDEDKDNDGNGIIQQYRPCNTLYSICEAIRIKYLNTKGICRIVKHNTTAEMKREGEEKKNI